MEIKKNVNGSEMTIALVGRLDTTTAPELEAVSAELQGITLLKLDFKELEYISSAGLRVLLAFHKIMVKQGTMEIYGVSEEINAVFDITGFSSYLNIK